MKKFLTMALILVLAVSQTVFADFSPHDSSVYYSAYSFDFTRANENAGKFTIAGNGNPNLSGTGYEASYLDEEAETVFDGYRLTSLQDDFSGAGYGLVHGDGFQIPAAYAGFANATSTTATYVKEFTFDVSGLSASSVFRIRDYASTTLNWQIIVSKDTVELYGGTGVYSIPDAQKKNLKITMAICPNYNNWGAVAAIWINDNPFFESAITSAVKKDYLPTGMTQFYFFSCAKNDALVVKNFKSYYSEAVTPDKVIENKDDLTSVNSIDFSQTAVNEGKLILPSSLGTGFTAADNEVPVGEVQAGLKLKVTEDGGLASFMVNGGRSSQFWYGTNANYTHYWEFTADISQLNEWDGYRVNYKVLNGSNAEKTLCTLAVGTRFIGIGFKEDTTENVTKPGFVGEYEIPAGTELTDARIGVSYDPAIKELKVLLNGEVIISGINHAYDSDINTWYSCGGGIVFGNFYNEKQNAEFVIKNINCGYYLTSSRPAEGAFSASVSEIAKEGNTASATVTLSKEGEKGYYNCANLFIAVYDSNNMIKSVGSVVGKVNGGESGKEFKATAEGYNEGDRTTTFLWEKGTLKPLLP